MRTVGGPETQRHVLVDGNNLLQRVYYVFIEGRIKSGNPLLSGPRGYPTGLIYGCLSFLSSWMYDLEPITSVSVFFDGSSARRRALDPTYKASREEQKRGLRLSGPDAVNNPITLRDGFEASSEIQVLVHLLRLLGCDIYHDLEEEADDLIATYCKLHPDTVRVIVSDDKDFFQLLTDPRIVTFRPGAKDNRFCDAEGAEAVWGRLLKGKHPKVPCSHVRMFKTLCGDHSDDIVGVPLLRKRVAVGVCHHPTVDDVLKSGLPGFSALEKEKLQSLSDRLKLNWELVGLKEDLDINKCLSRSHQDFRLASDICREDLLMDGLDLGPFRPAKDSPAPGPPLLDWMLDI